MLVNKCRLRTAKTLKTSFKNIKLAIFSVKDLRNDSIVMLTMSLKSFGYILKKNPKVGHSIKPLFFCQSRAV